MKKKWIFALLCAFLVSGLFGCGNNVPEGTVATVNKEPISQEELDMNYNQIIQMYSMYGYDVTSDDFKVTARNSILDSLVDQELELQEAEKRGLEVTDEDVDAEINSLVEDQYGGSQEDFEAAVEKAGMTLEYYKKAQKDYLLLQKLQEDLVNNPETVDVIKARHILVDSEDKAKELIDQLDNGADFATLAEENSTDTGSAADGGELGYFAVTGKTTSKMVTEFTEAAEGLDVGEYSKEPVKTQYGYHIILVEDKQSGVNLLDDAEKYDSVLQGIYNYGLQNLADSLRDEADIKILIDTESVPEEPKADTAAADGTDDVNVDSDNTTATEDDNNGAATGEEQATE